MGAWKSTEVKLSSPNEFSIEESGLDKLVLKVPALKATCEVTSDGKEVAVEGPDIPTGLRLSLTRTGPYTFKLVQKLNGSVISSSVYTVSEDRETMTEVGGAPGIRRRPWFGKGSACGGSRAAAAPGWAESTRRRTLEAVHLLPRL